MMTLLILDSPRPLIIDFDSVPGLLYRVDIDDVADVSEVYAASIVRVEMCRLTSFYVCIALGFENGPGEGADIGPCAQLS
jgi:hypothetical protein